MNELEALKTTVSKNTGYSVNVYTDTVAESNYEIIVGRTTNRGKGTVKKLTSNKYSITVKGNKVYLEGGSAHTVSIAIAEFGRLISEGNLTNDDSFVSYYDSAVENYDTSVKYTRTWGDDFDYDFEGINGIGEDKWYVVPTGDGNGGVRDGRLCTRSRDPDVVYVKNGLLNINAKYDEKYYHGAMLYTSSTMNYKYGYVEMRARLPHGDGFWIALWTTSKDSNGAVYGPEIDIIEMFGDSTYAAANIHGWQRSNTSFEDTYGVGSVNQSFVTWNSKYDHWSYQRTGSKYNTTGQCYIETDEANKLNNDFHTYGYLATPEKIAFTFDGVEYWSIDATKAPAILTDTLDCYSYLRLSQATCFAEGSGKPMADDDPQWELGNNFEVDYVHLYQLNDGIQKLHLGSDPLPDAQ